MEAAIVKLASDSDLLGHHLPYEFDMLQRTFEALEAGGHSSTISNALIESFCIHARLLIEFFCNKQSVKAREFTGGFYSAKFVGDKIDGAETKLNTQIAHLSRRRTIDPDQKIDGPERLKLLVAIEKEAENFALHSSPQFQDIFSAPKPIGMNYFHNSSILPEATKITSPKAQNSPAKEA